MAVAWLWISSLPAGGLLLAKRAARPKEARRWACATAKRAARGPEEVGLRDGEVGGSTGGGEEVGTT